jgi:peptidoglycan/xylan/chitin deacetylase (PgdA/CDA1 family)
VFFALRRTGAPLAVAVVYHRIDDRPGDPRTELVPALGAALFGAQLAFLARHFDLVPASAVVDAARTRRRGHRLPAAITFDDDIRSHVGAAMPALVGARAPATFFLCGASLHAPFCFWWERLQRAYDAGHLDGDIHEEGRRFERLGPEDGDARSAELASLTGGDPDDAGLRAGEVGQLREAGMEIGFHTLRHDMLPLLAPGALATAMHDGRADLEAVTGPLTTIAYPFGQFDAAVVRAAREAGFTWGFTTEQVAIAASDDPLALGRVDASLHSVGDLAYGLARALLARYRGRAARY